MIPRAAQFPVVLALIVCAIAAACRQQTEAAKSDRPTFEAMVFTVGDSMLPTFKNGELVRVELCRFSDLATRDTVVRWDARAKTYTHHRLDHRDALGRWITRGDNNPGDDTDPMTPDEFVGRSRKFGQ